METVTKKIRVQKTKDLTFQQVLDAKIAFMGGKSIKTIANELNVSQSALEAIFERFNTLYASTLPTLKADQEIVQQTIMQKLDPIREELSMNAYTILQKSDQRLKDALDDEDVPIKPSDLSSISDVASKRIERNTGLNLGSDSDDKNITKIDMSTKVTQIFDGIFSREKIDEIKKRAGVIDVDVL